MVSQRNKVAATGLVSSENHKTRLRVILIAALGSDTSVFRQYLNLPIGKNNLCFMWDGVCIPRQFGGGFLEKGIL